MCRIHSCFVCSGILWIGLFAAIIGGAFMAAIHAVLSIRFLVDQIVSGVVINILAVGVTGFYPPGDLYREIRLARLRFYRYGIFRIYLIFLLSDKFFSDISLWSMQC